MKVRFHASPVLDSRMPLWRARLVFVVLMLGFSSLAAKALYLQGLSNEFLQRQGERRYERTVTLPATRGKIYDRTGTAVLASSVPVRAIWAIPEDATALSDGQKQQLASLLDMSVADIDRRLSDLNRNFVYVRRQVSMDAADKIRALNLPGIHQEPEMRRVYPEAELTAHVLGFTDIEDIGIEGVELAFDRALSGTPGSRRVIKDRLGRIVEDVQAIVPPVDGQDLYLSIDARIQFDLFTALQQAVDEQKALAATGVVLDVRSGEVLALANWPSYNPNDRNDRQGSALRNRAVTDTFEVGSILKPFTAALALDIKRIDQDTLFHTGNGRYRYKGNTISDVSKNGTITVADILKRSSNIGMTMISEKLSSEEMWGNFNRLGFGRAPQASFPGVASGRLRPWERWRPIERATMAYGYGLSTSLLQIAHAYTALARDGDMVSLSLLRRDGQAASVPVYRPEIARELRVMLERAIGSDGTHLAQVAGYRAAGKSGTARKIINGQYSTHRYHSSYVGFAPVSDPRVVVAIMIDEPGAGAYYGGRVAAPVFSEVTGKALRRLGIEPDAPVESLVAVGKGGDPLP